MLLFNNVFCFCCKHLRYEHNNRALLITLYKILNIENNIEILKN